MKGAQTRKILWPTVDSTGIGPSCSAGGRCTAQAIVGIEGRTHRNSHSVVVPRPGMCVTLNWAWRQNPSVVNFVEGSKDHRTCLSELRFAGDETPRLASYKNKTQIITIVVGGA